MTAKTGEPSWKWRRPLIYGTVGFCMICIGTMIDASDTELNRTIASGLLWLMGAVVIGYAGFATAQDATAIIAARTGRPYATDMQPTPPAPVIVPPGTSTTVNVTNDPNQPPSGYAD